MTMQRKQAPFSARRIGAELGAGVQTLSPAVLARLAAMREQALAGGVTPAARRAPVRPLLAWLLAVGVAASLLAGSHWSAQQRLAHLASLDAQLLSDDLPVDAYLDPEFKEWLRRHTDS